MVPNTVCRSLRIEFSEPPFTPRPSSNRPVFDMRSQANAPMTSGDGLHEKGLFRSADQHNSRLPEFGSRMKSNPVDPR
jgi:hypothetical protein